MKRVSLHSEKTIVLVHGATCQGSDWGEVVPLLKKLGHKVYAVDLPGHGCDTKPLGEQSITTYAEYVAELIRKLNTKVCLVGHSMSGTVISMVGEKIPEYIDELVYFAAWLLEDGWSCNGIGTSYSPWPWDMSFYDKDVLALPDNPEIRESVAALTEPIHVTDERWGKLTRYYIKTMQDDRIEPEIQEKMLEKYPCAAVYELNTGHMAFEENPVELAAVIHDITIDADR